MCSVGPAGLKSSARYQGEFVSNLLCQSCCSNGFPKYHRYRGAKTNGAIGCQNSLDQCSGHLFRGKASHVGTPVKMA